MKTHFSSTTTPLPKHTTSKVKTIAMASALAITLSGAAFADTFNVPGTSNAWLAGQPDDSTSPGDGLPTLFTNFAAGDSLMFSASGSAGYQAGSESGPDGIAGYDLSNNAFDNISGITHSQANALIAVFLDGTNPLSADASTTPDALDFGPTGLTLDYTTIDPLLRQMFYIGDGVTSGNDQQTIVAPAGATQLFLGMNDGGQGTYFNNTGSFDVSVTGNTPQGVPEPSPWSMLALGIPALLGFRRFGRRSA